MTGDEFSHVIYDSNLNLNGVFIFGCPSPGFGGFGWAEVECACPDQGLSKEDKVAKKEAEKDQLRPHCGGPFSGGCEDSLASLE